MASLVRNIVAGILGSPTLLNPRETQYVQGALGAINAEVVTDCIAGPARDVQLDR
jgi:hypothetical protein